MKAIRPNTGPLWIYGNLIFVLLAGSSPVIPVQAACTQPPDGLVAWWPADGDPANLVGPPGVVQGGAVFVPGEVGQALILNGTAQYMATELDVQPSALPETTWEAWVYPTRLNHGSRQQVLSADSGSYGRSVLIEAHTTNFAVFTGTGVWQPTLATTNEWQHIAVVFTTNNVEFYRNGVRFSYNKAPTPRVSNNRLQIGRNASYGEYFQGLVDEVAVYNQALTADAIQALHAAGSAGKCKSGSGLADLAVSLQAEPDPLSLGQGLTNTVTVRNHGPDTAYAALLQMPLPAGTTFVSAQSSRGNCTHSGGVVYGALGNLTNGQVATATVVFTPTASGFVTSAATITSLAADPHPANDASQTTVTVFAHFTPEDGDWDLPTLVLADTPEADLMVRTGDIDNLGFGWASGFDPFSGKSTPAHGFPWSPEAEDPPGTDRIMVVSSYVGHPPAGTDGYTTSTVRPGNQVQPIQIDYDLGDLIVASAALQLFVDDFQAPSRHSQYAVTLNGIRIPALETILNSINQTGPVGKLISVNLPPDALEVVRTNRLTVLIDDTTTGAGDGFAIDFVKLLVNLRTFAQVGTVRGVIVDAASQQPIAGVQVDAGGGAPATTDELGQYELADVAAGLALVHATHQDYAPQIKPTDLIAGQTNIVDFALVIEPRLRVEKAGDQVSVSWLAALQGFALQVTESLSAPIDWRPEGSVPILVQNRNTVTVPPSLPARFYRLARP